MKVFDDVERLKAVVEAAYVVRSAKALHFLMRKLASFAVLVLQLRAAVDPCAGIAKDSA